MGERLIEMRSSKSAHAALPLQTLTSDESIYWIQKLCAADLWNKLTRHLEKMGKMVVEEE